MTNPLRAVCLGLALTAFSSLAPTAQLRAEPREVEHIHDFYEIHLGGLHVLDFSLDFTDRGRSFDALMILESRGLMETFGELRALVQGSGAWSGASDPLKAIRPEGYTRVHRESERAGVKEVRYTLGRPPEGYDNGRENKGVPPEKRWGALDPIATFAAARRLLRDAEPGAVITLPVFDGNLRYDFQAEVGDSEVISIDDKDVVTIPVTLTPHPISGFSRKHARSWEGETMTLHFTDDGAFWPVKFILNNALGGLIITRVGACDDPEVTCPSPLPQYLSANNQAEK